MFSGDITVEDQKERAAGYAAYVEGVLSEPAFVGCHWFQYMEQPTTGRVLDEENYQIGFVDSVDTPYAETIAAAREAGYSLYRFRRDASTSGTSKNNGRRTKTKDNDAA